MEPPEQNSCLSSSSDSTVVKMETNTDESSVEMGNMDNYVNVKTEDNPEEKYLSVEWEELDPPVPSEHESEVNNTDNIKQSRVIDNIDDDLLMAIALVCCSIKLKQRKNKKRRWCKEWHLKREQRAPEINLLSELKLENSDWYNILHINEESYLHILSLVTPLIQKTDTIMRRAITPHERLTATLQYITTGRSYEDLKRLTHISAQALGSIIPETCQAIYSALKKDYFKFPSTENEWKEVAKGFEERFNFPNCLGALSGKHVHIIPPPCSGSFYYNDLGYHSLVLMAIANANHELILCDFGTNGRASAVDVLENSKFYSKLVDGEMKIPLAEKVSMSERALPYVFLGNDAFGSRLDILCTFNEKYLTEEQRVFNSRFSRAYKVVENVFDIMAVRFKILQTKINVHPNKTNTIVMACCILHNYLLNNCLNYMPSDCFETDDFKTGLNFQIMGLSADSSNMIDSAQEAEQIRDVYLKYFSDEGKI